MLSQVSGTGKDGTHYHLNIGGYHRGQFFRAEYNDKPGMPLDLTKPRLYKWRFCSQKGANDLLAAQFEKVVEAWYQSNSNGEYFA